MRGYVLLSVLWRPQWPTFIAIVSNDFLSYNCVFWFRFALDTKHAAFAPLCCTCTFEESNGWKCARVWWRVLVPPLDPFPYGPTVAQDETACPNLFYHHHQNDPFLVTLGFLAFICWFFLGRCFFNGFRLTKSKKWACICIMKLRYNYLVNLLVWVGLFYTLMHMRVRGRVLLSTVRADWLFWRMLEPGVFWLVREWKEPCVILFPKSLILVTS